MEREGVGGVADGEDVAGVGCAGWDVRWGGLVRGERGVLGMRVDVCCLPWCSSEDSMSDLERWNSEQ